jgi:hypothetical protein
MIKYYNLYWKCEENANLIPASLKLANYLATIISNQLEFISIFFYSNWKLAYVKKIIFKLIIL